MADQSPIWVRKISTEDVLPLRAQVLRPHHPLMDCVFEGDCVPGAAHFGAGFATEEILAVGTICPEALPADSAGISKDQAVEAQGSQIWRLRGMATDERARGQGLGAKILLACIGHVEQNLTTTSSALIWAHARTGALKFYRRHGFQTRGGEYVLPGVGPHYLIFRELKIAI